MMLISASSVPTWLALWVFISSNRAGGLRLPFHWRSNRQEDASIHGDRGNLGSELPPSDVESAQLSSWRVVAAVLLALSNPIVGRPAMHLPAWNGVRFGRCFS